MQIEELDQWVTAWGFLVRVENHMFSALNCTVDPFRGEFGAAVFTAGLPKSHACCDVGCERKVPQHLAAILGALSQLRLALPPKVLNDLCVGPILLVEDISMRVSWLGAGVMHGTVFAHHPLHSQVPRIKLANLHGAMAAATLWPKQGDLLVTICIQSFVISTTF